jgi:GAF domain-containing protein
MPMDNRELNQLHRISQVLAYDLSLTDVLQLIVGVTAEMMDSKICSILLYDEDEQTLSIAATQSLSDAYKNKPPIRVNTSVSGRAVRDKQAQVIANVTEDDSFGYSEIARSEGLVSLLCIPMVSKGNCIGTINSYAAKKHDYTEKEIKLLSMVAAQAAIAIENARLHSATAAIRNDLDKRKLIDKAKAFLMKNRKLTEPEAFRFIQKQSMNRRLPMRQIAEAIVLSYDLEGGSSPTALTESSST